LKNRIYYIISDVEWNNRKPSLVLVDINYDPPKIEGYIHIDEEWDIFTIEDVRKIEIDDMSMLIIYLQDGTKKTTKNFTFR